MNGLQVGLNVRFIGWFVQFFPLLMVGVGWPVEIGGKAYKWGVFGYLGLFFNIVPNVVMIMRVFMQDLNMMSGAVGPPVDGQNTLDVVLKGIARVTNTNDSYYYD